MTNNETILVTGGAGYIGSVVSHVLQEEGFSVIIVDDLSKGHKNALAPKAKFYKCSTLDKEAFSAVFKENPDIKGIMHFAASIEVGESVKKPDKYFYNNVLGSLNTIDLANQHGIEGFILSSTAAIYGNPETIPIPENCPAKPINPYGLSKLQVEQFLQYYHEAYGFKYSALRYFNACGGYKHLGEDHNPESHLIPNILKVPLGQNNEIKIFGDTYNTKDGTPIRDYIHVEDLAKAHILALKAIFKGKISNEAFNIGSKSGYSVLEVLEMAEKVTGKKIPKIITGPREGDPEQLIADNTKIRNILGWQPKHNLESIITSAWQWHSSNPYGYQNCQ